MSPMLCLPEAGTLQAEALLHCTPPVKVSRVWGLGSGVEGFRV